MLHVMWQDGLSHKGYCSMTGVGVGVGVGRQRHRNR